MSLRTAGIALSAVALIGAQASAQVAEPRFAGDWSLDVSRSAATMGMPSAASYRIVFAGDTLKMSGESTTGDVVVKNDLMVGFDGKSWSNTLKQSGYEVPMATIAKWDGKLMSIVMTGAVGDAEVMQDVKWTLSEDGKTFVSSRRIMVNGEEYATASMTFIRK